MKKVIEGLCKEREEKTLKIYQLETEHKYKDEYINEILEVNKNNHNKLKLYENNDKETVNKFTEYAKMIGKSLSEEKKQEIDNVFKNKYQELRKNTIYY